MDLKDIQKIFKPKGVVGRGMTYQGKSVRVASCSFQGDKVRVLGFNEAKLPESPAGQVEFLIQLALKADTEVALSFVHKNLKIKKVSIPSASQKNLAQAIKWQLYGEAKEAAATAQVCFHANGISGPKTAEYWAYGLPKPIIQEMKEKLELLKIKPVAAEPLPLSLVAWADCLYPNLKKNVGIMYYSNGRGDFVGLKEGQFFHWGSFEEEVPEMIDENADSSKISSADLGVRFQGLMDEFLLKAELPQLDEIWLAGDWEEETAVADLSNMFAISCVKMGEGETAVTFMEEQQKLAYRFAAELGMSIFPRSEL